MPAQYTFGNAARNSVIGPGYADVDVALEKDVQVSDGPRVQLRLEIFNPFNRAHFDTPNRTFGTPNVGRIFSAEPARPTQVAVKFLF